MNMTFIIVYAIWLLSEVLLNRLLHSNASDKQGADKNSLLIIWLTIAVSMFISIYIAGRFYFPIFANPSYTYTGLVVIVVGILLRFAAIRSLGKFFTVDVTIREGHQLKKDGFYKYLRHPSYFASLISFIGFGISLNNWISLIVITLAIIAAFSYRIKVEEKTLIEQFGSAYIEYKKTTAGLIPFIF
ncbi:MAG: isoprenylcysteine carboxylmethyltransferase family protein [Agriterribacter sp.]